VEEDQQRHARQPDREQRRHDAQLRRGVMSPCGQDQVDRVADFLMSAPRLITPGLSPAELSRCEPPKMLKQVGARSNVCTTKTQPSLNARNGPKFQIDVRQSAL